MECVLLIRRANLLWPCIWNIRRFFLLSPARARSRRWSFRPRGLQTLHQQKKNTCTIYDVMLKSRRECKAEHFFSLLVPFFCGFKCCWYCPLIVVIIIFMTVFIYELCLPIFCVCSVFEHHHHHDAAAAVEMCVCENVSRYLGKLLRFGVRVCVCDRMWGKFLQLRTDIGSELTGSRHRFQCKWFCFTIWTPIEISSALTFVTSIDTHTHTYRWNQPRHHCLYNDRKWLAPIQHSCVCVCAWMTIVV